MNRIPLAFAETRISEWKLRTRTLTFGKLPSVMGILNVTPDSFSDGGTYFSTQLAIDQALRMEDEGADLIDIGGESTRPYSLPVNADEELRRIVPVLQTLQGRLSIPFSIDTSKAVVAEAAIELNAEIINDVSGLCRDPNMLELAKTFQVGVCVMHMLGSPQTMQDNPLYSNVVSEILGYLRQRDQDLTSQGVDPLRICLDPGIGFGKTHEHNLQLLRQISEFHSLRRPLLVGHSKKGFIAKVLSIGQNKAERSAGTLGVSLALARRGIQILRVHDVGLTKQALALFEASGGLE